MIEIICRGRHVIVDLAGLSVAEVRRQVGPEYGITDKSVAKLNGTRVKTSLEAETCLSDGDKLSFAEVRSTGAIVIAVALPLALALTCAAFVYGFVNNTATFKNSSADANFVRVTANTSSQPAMKVFGSFKGTTGSGDLFNIEPDAGFPGSLVASVSLANVDRLVKCYRMMALLIEARDSSNNLVDINMDTYQNDKDYALLTLSNGAVELHLPGADNYTIKLRSGYYVSHIYSSGWHSGDTTPIFYCDVTQR